MKTKNLLVSALLALGVALSAHAQTVSADFGDLLLGFKKGSSTGATTNLVVNLGGSSNFLSGGTYATGSEVFLSQLSVADLNAIYGNGAAAAGWKYNGVTWAVEGTTGLVSGDGSGPANNTVWTTFRTGTPTPLGSQGGMATSIGNVYLGLDGAAATENSSSAAALAQPNAWNTGVGANFNTGGTPTALNTALGSGGTVSLKLYELVQSASTATELGTFKLYSDGQFSFTSFTAIPEPSTYAALLGVVTLGVVAVRRRRQAALEV